MWQTMRGSGPLVALLVLATMIGVGACVPRLQDIGPPIREPALTDEYFITADGTRLPYQMWRPTADPDAVILALHGFNDYSNAFARPAAWWAERGVLTYAYDQRGFGATAEPRIWPGTTALTHDLRTVVNLIERRHPELPLIILGTSMGGAVVMAAATAGISRDHTSPPLPAHARLVLVAPAVRGRETMSPFYRASLWLTTHLMPALPVSARGMKITPSDNTEMLRELSRDALVIKETRIDAVYGLVNLMDAALTAAPRLRHRSLILYGEHDDIIDRGPTELMLSQLTGPRDVVTYPDGYHMLLRDLQGEVVWRDVLAWIADPGQTLPSRAGAKSEGVVAGN